MKIKKYIPLLLLLVTVIVSVTICTRAEFTDVPANASYTAAVNRMDALGVLSGNESGAYKPNYSLSREQFVKAVVIAAGLADKAESMKGDTVFLDVAGESWSSGFINLAYQKGFLAETSKSKFRPYDNITFAEACSIVVRALGYTDKDVLGKWPDDYINRARQLGVIENLSLKSNDKLQKWAAAVMLDELWINLIKNKDYPDAERIFSSDSSLYVECMVLGDSKTSEGLTEHQLLTDKGTFYNLDAEARFELGYKYRLITDGSSIIKASGKIGTVKCITVKHALDNKISYNDGGTEQSMTLPESTDYYYNGVKQKYQDIKNIIKKNTSLLFLYNETQTGFASADIIDPLYSKPQIANNFVPSSNRLGTIDFSMNPTIIKNGRPIDISQILEGDIVYQVSDVWNKNRYILVEDKKVGGKVTGILPNKLSPKTLQIENTNYDLSSDTDLAGIIGDTFNIEVDDNVVVSLGYDGKIVDIQYPGSEDGSKYAFVINTGMELEREEAGGRVNVLYYAHLLLDNGITTTYRVTSDPAEMKGKLVKYSHTDNRTVSLEQLIYNYPEETSINKGDRQLGTEDVTDNIKIFDLISDDYGGDAQVSLLDWNDLPDGTLQKGKLLYSNKVGTFGDINVLLTDDILNRKYKSAVVKKFTSRPGGVSYTLLVDGKEYSFNEMIPNVDIGSIVQVKMTGTGIERVVDNKTPAVKDTSVQAMNSRKIKVDNKSYKLKNNVTVYYKDFARNITVKTLGDIDLNRVYGSVSVYLDNGADGKVEVIMLSESVSG